MSASRRAFLMRQAWLLALGGTGLMAGREAQASSDELAFDAVSMRDALAALGGIPATGAEIMLSAPELVENGAVVPVTVDCRLASAREVYIVVEANPNPLVVRFDIPEGTDAWVSTRIKMAASGSVYAVVRADGKLYAASREVQVMVGGCG